MNDPAPPRPAVVSLELLLDPGLESHIRAEWQALKEAGLSSLGAHEAPSNRPHITLVVRPSIPPVSPVDLGAVVTLPVPVTLGGLVLFGSGDRRVLARSVVPTEELLTLHAALHALAGGEGDNAPHTRPGEWAPHITLARRLRLDALPQALRMLDDVGLPPTGTSATTLRRWDAASATVTTLLGQP
ncbi:2'-5' RNA ligase family protein [Conyzicola nivalis]|uniref:2'-5' RNA ligase family protein n=1 Tax=Conyzicola nivalis TaxID=1477021 RepID=A0A916SS34_9MICO|nr:2'-5' RNA ligase family protein [Conyzicola nivalis]GGB13432.1 hypothetical protein GCM10010979_29810 [Conyzicola nivalis]